MAKKIRRKAIIPKPGRIKLNPLLKLFKKHKTLKWFFPIVALAILISVLITNHQAVQGISSYKWRVPILTYHWIGCPDSSIPAASRYLYVCPADFRNQISTLQAQGWTIMTGREFVARFKANNPPPAKTVVLTIDGSQYTDTMLAGQILNEYGAKATFFISPGYLGKPGNLTWTNVKSLTAKGQDIENHGMNHKDLTTLNGTTPGTPLYQEIADASDAIQSKLGYRPNFFCYPNGQFDDESRTALRAVPGMLAATYSKGNLDPNIALEDSASPMQMIRLSVRGEYTLSQYMNLLAPYTNITPTLTPTVTITPVPTLTPTATIIPTQASSSSDTATVRKTSKR